jgi:hypothetical protein
MHVISYTTGRALCGRAVPASWLIVAHNGSSKAKYRCYQCKDVFERLIQSHEREQRHAPIARGAYAVVVPTGGVLVLRGRSELMVYGTEHEAKAKLPKGCTLVRVDIVPARKGGGA